MEPGYVIVSDATVDLPQDVVEKYEIQVIPMTFRMGEPDYSFLPDEKNISCKEFYERLRDGEESVTTQINPVVYKDFFRSFLQEGLDVFYIAFSSGLSGTYNSARLMAEEVMEEFPQRKVLVFDSLCASIGEGLLVLEAAKRRQMGMSLSEVAEWTAKNNTRVCHWFTVDDLYHLKRGGRLNSLEALVGTALKIKPVLSTDREGKLVVVAKLRGMKKAMEYLKERMVEDGTDPANQTVLIAHGDAPEALEAFKELIVSQTGVTDIITCNIGPIIGTHTGSGMLALTFFGENYKF